jgi:hypothetical protein
MGLYGRPRLGGGGRFACKCDYLMADGHTWGLQVACFHQAVWNHPSSFQKEPVEDDFT